LLRWVRCRIDLPQDRWLELKAMCLIWFGFIFSSFGWLYAQSSEVGTFEFRSSGICFNRIARGQHPWERVTALAQDNRGLMWFGTDRGLYRFDGYRAERPSGVLFQAPVVAIAKDEQDRLWVANPGSVWRIDPIRGEADDPLYVTSKGPITALTVLDTSRLVIAGEGGVEWLEIATSQVSPRLEGQRVTMMACSQDSAWLVTRSGEFLRLDWGSGQRERVIGWQGDPPTCLHMDRDGRLWVGTKTGGVSRFDPHDGRWWQVHETSFEAGAPIRALHRDRTGRIWVAVTGRGVGWVDPGGDRVTSVSPVGIGTRLSSVTTLSEDSRGGLWFGTRGEGVAWCHSLAAEFRSYSFGQSGRGRRVQAVLEDRIGRVWIGTEKGLTRFSGDRDSSQRYRFDSNLIGALPGRSVRCLFEDSQSTIWVGTERGWCRYEPGREGFYADPDWLGSPPVTAFGETSQGLWIGFDGGGLVRLNNGAASTLDADEHGLDRVRHLVTDRDDTLWIATAHGLGRLPVGSERLTWIPSPDNSRQADVTSLLVDSDARIWVGSTRGLSLLRSAEDTTLEPLGPEQPFEVRALIQDRDGAVWVSTPRGLYCVRSEGEWSHFTSYDGMLNSALGAHAAILSGSGEVWIGGASALSVFRPDWVKRMNQPARLLVSRIATENRSIPDWSSRIEVGPEVEVLCLEFALADYAHPQHNRFRYRFLGDSDRWVDLGNREQLTLARPRAGDYDLEVDAVNYRGQAAAEPLRLALSVRPPFWQTTTFRILALLLILVLAHFAFQGMRRLTQALMVWKKTAVIGPYRAMEVIGKGGMGTVYRARDMGNGQIVALKVLDRAFSKDPVRKQRFLRESLICERIKHPNVVSIINKGEHNDQVYYAMEHVGGDTLRQLIERECIDVRLAMVIFEVVMEVLDAIHDAGVVHRDLKPENIMLTGALNTNQLKTLMELRLMVRLNLRLLDFGVAKAAGLHTLTETGILAGTVCYLPPEYVKGKSKPGPEVDYYGLGVVLYEMVTGQALYRADNYLSMICEVLETEPSPPDQINPAVPRAMSEFILDLLAKRPEQRLDNPSEILQRLEMLQVRMFGRPN